MDTNFSDLASTTSNEYLLKAEAVFVSQKHKLLSDFAVYFQSVCNSIIGLQREGALSEISYLEFTLLYTSIVNRRYVAEVWVYGDDWYFDDSPRKIGEYDISFLFVQYNELWDSLLTARKRYIGKVTASEVKSYMMQVLPDFYSYFFNLVRFAIVDSVEKEPFIDIIRNNKFMINVGNYMANPEPVFIENKNKTNIDNDSLIESDEDNFNYKDFSGLDFSDYSLALFSFCYTQFRHSCLNNANFYLSDLIGASFRYACVEGCRFDNSDIHEADFSYALLKNSDFSCSNGSSGLPDTETWKHVGFFPVKFCHADLTNADFTEAELVGADFTGANLTGANFTDAVIIDAIFTDAIMDGAIFDGAIRDSSMLD